MDQLSEKYEQLMEKYLKLKQEYDQLKNQPKDYKYSYYETNDIPSYDEVNKKKNKKNCQDTHCLIFCCFAENTIIKVLENNKQIDKKISEIKLNDLVLIYQNGNLKYSKVNFFEKYEDEYKFYEIKIKSENKTKKIMVTGNHIMICYNEDMTNARYVTAENVKINDYFNTIDGLYKVYEINVKSKRNKYSLGVEEGVILASDILVTCFNYNEINKNLSLDELLSSYKLKNFI